MTLTIAAKLTASSIEPCSVPSDLGYMWDFPAVPPATKCWATAASLAAGVARHWQWLPNNTVQYSLHTYREYVKGNKKGRRKGGLRTTR